MDVTYCHDRGMLTDVVLDANTETVDLCHKCLSNGETFSASFRLWDAPIFVGRVINSGYSILIRPTGRFAGSDELVTIVVTGEDVGVLPRLSDKETDEETSA